MRTGKVQTGVFLIFLSIFFLPSVSAEWWDEDWSYKKPVEVTERSNTSLSNYSVELEVDTASLISSGNMQSDCGDIRFLNQSETVKVDHWIQSGCDTNSTDIYLEVPSIGANESETFYMYYGNDQASSTSELTIGSSSDPAESCNQIYRKMENAPNMSYYLDPDQNGSSHEARCDIGVNEMGWTLLYNYDHAGGTDPNVNEGAWPQNHSAFSHQDNIQTVGYSQAIIESMRLRCETSNHNRIVHYVTKDTGAIKGILTDDATIGYQAVSNDAYKLPEHSGFLPDAAGSDTGESEPGPALFGRGFPMYEGGAHHWSIGEPNKGGSRWECDDSFPGDNQYDTLHQIWFKSDADAPKLNRTPSYSIKQQTRSKKLEERRIYLGSKPRTFFAENQTVRIEVEGDYAEIPSIQVFDPNGSEIVSDTMRNNSGVFEYSYDVNGSRGWYRLSIENFDWEKAFYRGEVWKGNYTDADGNKYTFRRELNVSEPGIQDRSAYPVDPYIEFGFDPASKSVRVISWNGSRMLEIPSQLYNASGALSGNLLFLSSLANGEKRTYYVMSSKENYSKNYSGLESGFDGSEASVENSFYNLSFKEKYGGLLTEAKLLRGHKQQVQGQKPLDFYPELNIGLSSYSARSDITSKLSVSEGPLMTEIKAQGNLNDLSRYPYTIECQAYLRNSYIECEKNLTSTQAETWDDLKLNGLVLEDGRFTWASWEKSGTISYDELVEGTGDSSSFANPQWISFFNNNTGDAVAELFLNRSFSAQKNPGFTLDDSSGSEFFTQTVIQGGESVQEGDYFYTRTARAFYSGLEEAQKPRELYDSLSNPPNIQKGIEKTNDNDNPVYKESGNISSNSSSEIKVFARWDDDTFLQKYEINISGRGLEGDNTTFFSNESQIRDEGGFTNSSWVNVTLNSSQINSGRIYANITVTDVAGKSNTSFFSFNVTDTSPPGLSAISLEPSENSSIDPRKKVEVSVNLTDYTGVSQANLYYTNGTVYRKKTLTESSGGDYESRYNTSITPGFNKTYSYIIEAVDDRGNKVNSSERKIYSLWDYTWETDFHLKNMTATFNSNVSTGNFTVNNTGDFDLDFQFSTGALNSRTWINGSQLEETFTVKNGSSEFFRINSTTRSGESTEGVDTFNLTITAGNHGKRFKAYEVVTSTGGPFLFTEFTEYNSTVTVGDDNLTLSAETTNKGSERAENVNLTFQLPKGFKTSSDLTSPTSLGIDVGNSYGHTITYSVSDKASTGTRTVNVTARSTNETQTAQIQIELNKDAQTIIQQPSGGGGGGGGAGGSDTGLSGKQKQKLFQTEETYSIVRGKNANFTLKVENPFDSGSLENVELEVTGFLDQYLSVQPQQIEKIPVNSSKNFTIKIEAPDYFSRGEYRLNMTITGINNQSRVIKSGNETVVVKDTTKMTEYRAVNLVVHELSKETARKSLNQSQRLVKELEEKEMLSRELNSSVRQIQEAIKAGNYQQARQLSQQIQQSYTNAVKARQTIQNVTELIDEAEYRGLDTPRTERTLKMAKAALQRGDYSLALQRAQEARSLYTIETQGKTNYINLIKRKWQQLSLAMFMIVLTGFAGVRRGKVSLIERRIQNLEEERQSVRKRMEDLQEQCFVDETISLTEYHAGMDQYREQLSDNVSREITLESKKLYWLKMMRSQPALREKRERLKSLIKQAQKEYFEEGTISKTLYETKIERYRNELAEVEENLAEIEIKKRTGLRGKLNEQLK